MRTVLRSDAKKHRDLLLNAASEIFASHGYGAPLDSISARAGVGQATLYRNFPNRDALLVALLSRCMEGLEAAMRDTPLVEHPLALLEAMAEHSVLNPAMGEYWTVLPQDSPDFIAGKERFFTLARRGLKEAQAAGRVRQDLTAEDIGLISHTFRAIRLGAEEPERRRTKQRLLSFLTQGITPRAAL